MKLPGRHRQALILKYLEDRRVSDIAAILGQSEKAVESLLTRSRQAFKELLCKQFKAPQAQGSDWL